MFYIDIHTNVLPIRCETSIHTNETFGFNGSKKRSFVWVENLAWLSSLSGSNNLDENKYKFTLFGTNTDKNDIIQNKFLD